MKIRLTQTLLYNIKNPEKPYWITDGLTQNLRLYVGKSGKLVWYVRHLEENGKSGSYKLGPAGDVLTVAVAREMANDFLARLARGEQPQNEKKTKRNALNGNTLGDFIDDFYRPWVVTNRRSGKLTVLGLDSAFRDFYTCTVESLTLLEFEKWRTVRMESGSKAATVNRLMGKLKTALNWGVEMGIIKANPLQRMKALREHDSDIKVRYLSDNERARLMNALDARETEIREARGRHIEWHIKRGYAAIPELFGEFADHLKPMVLLSLNTGIRQGNLFALKWGDIDFDSQTVTLRANDTKSGKTTRLPLNSEAVAVLTRWRLQSENTRSEALIFPSPVTGGLMNNVKKAWHGILKVAEIDNFRWHDMRHDYASQLMMAGIDLNTVRELMGHADLKMTQRYAHLSPDAKARAVEVLAQKFARISSDLLERQS